MERWTRTMIRLRWAVVAAWLVAIGLGVVASSKLPPLLSNTFSVPGSDSERARNLLAQHFGQRDEGGYIVVFRVADAADPATRARLQGVLVRAARVVPTGEPRPLQAAGAHVLFGNVDSSLHLDRAKAYTATLRRALPPTAYVTGQAAIQHDLDPIFSRDLHKGESIALPIALAVLLAVFGLSWAVLIPFLFAGGTIFGTLGLVYLIARHYAMATYVTNLVQLIGLAIAIDYSLLVVYRFREELAHGRPKDEAIVATMKTAGRAVIFSGATVAIGLALLVVMPIPFVRSMGIGGFLIPLVSVAAAATLQPALLSLFGRRGTRRVRVLRFRPPRDVDRGFWARLARSIMRRPIPYLAVGGTILVACALPAFALQLTPGSAQGIPQSPSSVKGLNVLRAAIGPGALSPTLVVVDAGKNGKATAPINAAAIGRLTRELRRDPQIALVTFAPKPPFVDASGRYARIIAAGRAEYGDPPAQAFAHRLRDTLIPAARFPARTAVLAGGGPPEGIDFLDRAYGVFPYLVLAVLVLTYLVLLRAFRSLLLPLKAVLLNLLSVAATYGLLVVVFRWGAGADLAGLYTSPQIEGWIPIFLFAMLFGLSMDYEVFLVTRMRESWDHVQENSRAVAHGLERTGRIITAAAVIMVAAFSGFVAGSIVGLQEFGFGLAVAILLDATLVRAILVPSLMAVFGRWNWWLPAHVARLARVEPSPLERPLAIPPTL